jgi:hypothetical protein
MERAWVWLKKHHKINKIASILISSSFAYWTLSYKHLAFRYYDYNYNNGIEGMWLRHANEYNFIVWFTFIYYAFHALAELMELYSTVLSKDRGSLGLLFELNSVLGVVLALYTTIFVLSGRSVVQNS